MTTTELFRVEYAPDVGKHPELADAARRASETLFGVIKGDGPPTDAYADPDHRVRAHWAVIDDLGGGPVLRLTLTDGPDAVEFVLRPSDVSREDGWYAMSKAYRALLRATSHRLVRAMMSHTGGADE